MRILKEWTPTWWLYNISETYGAVVKRQISKKFDKDIVVVRADIPVKKSKKAFDDVL
jgi:hypothetical protein